MGPLANLPLKFVHRYRDRHGKVRHYFRRAGCKKEPLPGLPGSREFMDAYQAALAGETVQPTPAIADRSKPGTVAHAVALYFGSLAFGNLAPLTQSQRRGTLEHFREEYGELHLRTLQRRNIEAMLAQKTPHAAKNMLKALRGLMGTALVAGLIDNDPTSEVRVRLRETGGFRTWTEEEIAQGSTSGAASFKSGKPRPVLRSTFRCILPCKKSWPRSRWQSI